VARENKKYIEFRCIKEIRRKLCSGRAQNGPAEAAPDLLQP
jgi:hypothetical protein